MESTFWKSVWILAFQGDVVEHKKSVLRLWYSCLEVKNEKDLSKVDYLIIPWWESTVIWKFLIESWLNKKIIKRYEKWNLSIWWTCAWAILLAVTSENYCMWLIDIWIKRNWYWSQINSFVKKLKFESLAKTFDAVFIRAPIIKKVWKDVKVLVKENNNPVLCSFEKILVSTFHPELTNDDLIIKYFLTNF